MDPLYLAKRGPSSSRSCARPLACARASACPSEPACATTWAIAQARASAKSLRLDYNARVERAASALSGKTFDLIDSMKHEMAALSARREFERALELRDEIAALERLQERQRVEHSRKYDQDIISYAIDSGNVYLMLFKVYRGTLEGKEDFVFAYTENFLEEFLVQYYSENEPPEELIMAEVPG